MVAFKVADVEQFVMRRVAKQFVEKLSGVVPGLRMAEQVGAEHAN